MTNYKIIFEIYGHPASLNTQQSEGQALTGPLHG